MNTVFFVLCFTLIIISGPVESFFRLDIDDLDLPHIKLRNAKYYQTAGRRGRVLPLGTTRYVLVVTDPNCEFVVGTIQSGVFCPLVVPKGNLPIPPKQQEDPNQYEKVIVRIDEMRDGDIANVTIPISSDHSLNNKFFKPVSRGQIARAKIY